MIKSIPSLSLSEENYLKAIYKLVEQGGNKITTNSISEMVMTSPASVTDMLKKLADKKMLNYARYHGVSLTATGKKVAGMIVRKHRLWELFLVEKLHYSWDEVHEIAEQLEHIQSESLVKRLFTFLGNPTVDPHGDPIPDENGNILPISNLFLSAVETDQKVKVSGVKDHTPKFLKYLDELGIKNGSELTIKNKNEFDQSMSVKVNGIRGDRFISKDVANNIMVSTQTF